MKLCVVLIVGGHTTFLPTTFDPYGSVLSGKERRMPCAVLPGTNSSGAVPGVSGRTERVSATRGGVRRCAVGAWRAAHQMVHGR